MERLWGYCLVLCSDYYAFAHKLMEFRFFTPVRHVHDISQIRLSWLISRLRQRDKLAEHVPDLDKRRIASANDPFFDPIVRTCIVSDILYK